jgi:hypothetical protein
MQARPCTDGGAAAYVRCYSTRTRELIEAGADEKGQRECATLLCETVEYIPAGTRRL